MSLLRRLLSDSPQREFQLLTLFLRILHSVSLPRRIRNCKRLRFRTLLKRILWQGYLCSSSSYLPRRLCFTLYPSTRHAHTTILLLNLACLENTWKMSLLEGGCPMSITIHTSPNWINRSTNCALSHNSRGHISRFSIVPHRRKLVRFYFLCSLFLPLVAPPFFLLRMGLRVSGAIRYQSTVVSKRHVRISFPGLIKSNFFLLANCEAL